MNVFIMNKISRIHQSSGDCGFTMSEENFYCTIILNVIFFYFVGGNQPVSAQWPAVWNAYKWTCAVTVPTDRLILQYITIHRSVQYDRYARSSAISNPDNYSTTLYFSSRKLDIHYVLYTQQNSAATQPMSIHILTWSRYW